MERMAVVDPDKKLSAGDQVTVEIVEDREGGLPRIVTATGELDVRRWGVCESRAHGSRGRR